MRHELRVLAAGLDGAAAPGGGPGAAREGNPIAVAPGGGADEDFRVEVYGYAEVVCGCWDGDGKGGGRQEGRLCEFHGITRRSSIA